MSKKKSKIDLEHGLFSRIVKIKQNIIGEAYTASKDKNKTKRSILRSKGQSER